jgi:hypothetical protein
VVVSSVAPQLHCKAAADLADSSRAGKITKSSQTDETTKHAARHKARFWFGWTPIEAGFLLRWHGIHAMDFDKVMIQAVWNEGSEVQGIEPREWRKDVCGAWMYRDSYGNRNSEFGWEIDHIVAAKDGKDPDDSLSNLQPLHWENNVAKDDGPLVCAVKSQGNRNVRV